MLATYSEINFHVIGFASAVLASFTTALSTTASGKLLKEKLDPVNLLYYMSPLSFILILPMALVVEINDALPGLWGEDNIRMTLLMSGMAALALNITMFLLINNTSALTYTILGNCKVIFSILFSVMLFQNEITILNGVGCTTTLLGAAWYQQINYHMKTRPPKAEE